MQLNPERTTLRRAPQVIQSLNPVFEENKFNFKKIPQQELLMILPYDTIEVSIIINKSPLTLYHSLICPDVQNGLAQRVTLDTLRFCRDFLLSLEDNRGFRIGYNSPGALASVNHLHMHLINIEKDLYIDNAVNDRKYIHTTKRLTTLDLFFWKKASSRNGYTFYLNLNST